MKPVILPFFVGANGEALSSCVLQVSPAAIHMGVLLRGDGGSSLGLRAQRGPCWAGRKASSCAVLCAETVVILTQEKHMIEHKSPQ